MRELIVKVIAVVAVTCGIRVISRLAGARWGGLLLALPSSTALVLFFFARERGSAFAILAAEHSALGLVAAVALALTYAHGVGRHWRPPMVLFTAVAAYLAVTAVFLRLSPGNLAVTLLLATAGILAGCFASRGIPLPAEDQKAASTSWLRSLVLRTGVPVVCVMSVTGAAGVVGSQAAGLLSTFPAVLLTVLVVTHAEGSAAQASRTALAFPEGQFGMVAFILAFRSGCASLGLAGGLVWGYAAAISTLLLVTWVSSRIKTHQRIRTCPSPGRDLRGDQGAGVTAASASRNRSRAASQRRFTVGTETFKMAAASAWASS
jgi:hypothetical protein